MAKPKKRVLLLIPDPYGHRLMYALSEEFDVHSSGASVNLNDFREAIRTREFIVVSQLGGEASELLCQERSE